MPLTKDQINKRQIMYADGGPLTLRRMGGQPPLRKEAKTVSVATIAARMNELQKKIEALRATIKKP